MPGGYVRMRANWEHHVRAAVTSLIAEACAQIAEDAEDIAGRHHGSPVDVTWQVDPDTAEGWVGSTSPLAHLIERGTAPHEIRPNAAKALYWKGLGGGPWARVQHPGIVARPFLRPAAYRHRELHGYGYGGRFKSGELEFVRYDKRLPPLTPKRR